jgi:hypothetical protein
MTTVGINRFPQDLRWVDVWGLFTFYTGRKFSADLSQLSIPLTRVQHLIFGINLVNRKQL